MRTAIRILMSLWLIEKKAMKLCCDQEPQPADIRCQRGLSFLRSDLPISPFSVFAVFVEGIVYSSLIMSSVTHLICPRRCASTFCRHPLLILNLSTMISTAGAGVQQ